MFRKTIGVSLAAALSLGVAATLGSAASKAAEIPEPPGDYPNRNIEFMIPFGTGGSIDALARFLAPLMEERMGVGIGPVNRTGGNSVVGLRYVANQPADGYVLAGVTNDILGAIAAGNTDLTIDDFEWLVRAIPAVEMFFVRTDDERFQTFDGYVQYAKEHPGELTMTVGGKGGMEEIVATLVNNAAGVDVKYVPYNVPTERYAAFLGGHTDLLIEEPTDMKQYMEEGKIKPIVQMIDERPMAFNETPTTVEKGIDVTIGLWRGVAVKVGTPDEIVDYLYAVIKDVMESDKFKEWKEKRGQIRPPYNETPAQFEAAARRELEAIREALGQ